MLNEDGKLLIGVGETPVCLLPRMANRHGLISGATGTGKTITLKVMAESFSALGVPVFLADVKGDLAGCCRTGERTEAIDRRLTAMGLDPETFRYQPFPVRFWDVYGEMGHPVRTTVSEMGAPLLSRLLDLTAVQEGVLTIVFRVADEKGWLLSDLKDLRAMVWFQTDDKGKGYINILHCERLYRSPLLYATFLLWLLAELFEQLPEVGDPEQPKLVFFFDEAHLLFDDAPKALVDKVEQVVRLIRSKGVGVFFITQRPSDVPDSVLAQLGNKVQHALRAYTPAEQKAVRAAAQGFRANPAFDTQDAIMDLGTGEALVSFLDEKGRPSIVERVTILPPQSLMGPIDERRRSAELSYDELYGKYETPVDPESAYEIITADREAAAKAEAEAQAAKEREKLEQQKEKEKKATSKRRTSAGRKVANSALNAVGREVGRSFTRGLLGTLKKWF